MNPGDFPLPKGWAQATINDTGGYINGFAFKPAHRTSDGLPIIRIQNLTNEAKHLHTTNQEIDEIYKVVNGDILVSWSATLDAFIWDRGPAYVNQHIFKVIPNYGLFSKQLLFYWLKISVENLKNSEHLHGSTMKHINRGPFMAHKIPIPPKGEQARIVEKLEELLTDLDSGVAELKAAQAKLGQYRQSLLKSAVEGSLTADWREANAHSITESGEELLQRILIERRQHWEAKKLAEFEAKCKKPPNDWQKKYPEPVQPDTSELPELPEGWVWASVDQLALNKRYGSSSKTNDDSNGVPVLRMGNIQDGEIDYGKLKYLPKSHDEFPQLILVDGDLLFNRTNSAELVGKTAIYRDRGEETSYASYLISVTFSPSFSPDIAAYFINSTLGKSWISSVVNQTAGQANVNGTKLGELAIPLAPLVEQVAIVKELDLLKIQVQAQLSATELGLKQANSQRKNILQDAFSGKLVEQDNNDEPASVLLERIQAERVALAKQPKPKRPKKKTAKVIAMETLEAALLAKDDWADAQELFRDCGVVDGSDTDRIEALYAELRSLDGNGRLDIKREGDYDLLRLKGS